MNDVKLFELLTEISCHTAPASKKATPLVAAIVYKGDILTLGAAKRKTHPLQKKYGTTIFNFWLHAEIDAIQKAQRKNIDLSKCSIYVCRVKNFIIDNSFKQGWGMAKPCAGCESAIFAFGIKKTLWTVDGLMLKFDAST